MTNKKEWMSFDEGPDQRRPKLSEVARIVSCCADDDDDDRHWWTSLSGHQLALINGRRR